MTHDEALLKLLAIEPERKEVLLQVTGWPADETLAVIRRLVSQRRIRFGRDRRTDPRMYRATGVQA